MSWIARARLDGDRWDGEAVGADPERFRVRVLEGVEVLRVWEVEAAEAVYLAADVVADFPWGVDGSVAVAQWGEGYGWGAEAVVGL